MKPARDAHRAAATAPVWRRPDGTTVPLELLNFPELVAAHQMLASGDWSPEDTRLLLAAIENELELRWRKKTREPRDAAADRDDSSRAA